MFRTPSMSRCYLELLPGRGQLRQLPTRPSLCVSPEPARTQFPQLVLPVNSQLTTLRAPEVPPQLAGQFSTPRQRHGAVPAVSCLCHRYQANETANKCWFAQQNGTKCSVCTVSSSVTCVSLTRIGYNPIDEICERCLRSAEFSA